MQYDRRAPDGTTASFTTDGREAYVEDRFGSRTTYGYDTSNRLTSITDPVGKITTLHYNGTTGKLDYIQDPMGRRTLITVSNGNLTKIQDPVGGVPLLATYDSRHRLRTLKDRSGHTQGFAYDFAGRLAADTLPQVTVAGVATRPVVRFAAPETDVLVNPASGTGTAANPATGTDTSTIRGTVTDPLGHTTTYAINRFGAATLVEAPLGVVSTMAYDTQGRLTRSTAPSTHAMSYTWNGSDLVQTTDETTDLTVNIGYESTYHQVTSVSGDATPVTNFWSAGKLDSSRVGGATTRFTYDGYGRMLTSTDPLGHVVSVAHASTGLRNRTAITSAGRTTNFVPDSYGRVATTSAPGGGSSTTLYDLLNRVVKTIGPVNDTTIFTYADSLHLTAVRDAEGQLYQSTINALGWVEETTDPAGHSASVAYDSAGHAVETTDRAGNVVSATYNALGQVSSVTADGLTTTYSADPDGDFVATSNAASTDTIYFDIAGRPTTAVTVRGSHRYLRTSTYDDVGLRTQLAVSGMWNAAIGYHYNAVTHQLDTLTDVAGGKTALHYNGDQLADTVRLPTTGGLTVSTSYPSTHTTSSIRYSNSALNTALGVTYTLNESAQIGERIPVSQPGNGVQAGREFEYDLLQRLKRYDDYSIAPGGTQSECEDGALIDEDGNPCTIVTDSASKSTSNERTFAYDRVGNRRDAGAVIVDGNRLVRTGGALPDTLIYDLEGNLIERRRLSGGFTQTYAWNSLGQLIGVTTNGATVTFAYDGFGRRVRKTSSSGTTGYLYDGENLLAELDASGNRVAEYTYYPGIDQPHSVRRWSGGTSSKYYFAMEAPNNVVGLIDNSNTLVSHYAYRPFGTLESSTGTVANSLRFGAREYDSETGLYYNRARYYDPTTGRFISEDPIGLAGGVNEYAYAGGDPVNLVDPFGLDGCSPEMERHGGMTVTVNDAGDQWCIPYAVLGPVVITAWNPADEYWHGDWGSTTVRNAARAYSVSLQQAGVTYQIQVHAAPGTHDCSSYCTALLHAEGCNVPHVSTGNIASHPGWYSRVALGSVRPGDLIVRHGSPYGHMGQIVGRDGDGDFVVSDWGGRMSTPGRAPDSRTFSYWGPGQSAAHWFPGALASFSYYRPNCT